MRGWRPGTESAWPHLLSDSPDKSHLVIPILHLESGFFCLAYVSRTHWLDWSSELLLLEGQRSKFLVPVTFQRRQKKTPGNSTEAKAF